MRIDIATPAPRRSRGGNRITALRWAGHLRALHHRVKLISPDARSDADLLIALHAEKSLKAITSFRQRYRERPLIIALTGTDLYGSLKDRREAVLATLEQADRLIALQDLAKEELPASLSSKVRVVPQSCRVLVNQRARSRAPFEIAFIGHLRPVKDPLTFLRALALLPQDSAVLGTFIGEMLDPDLAPEFQRLLASCDRARWLGPLSHDETIFHLTGCQALVSTSLLEGGANVVSEALVNDVPVLATAISGTCGMLGYDDPGLFPPRDAATLAQRLLRLERDPEFERELRAHQRPLATRYEPAAERRALEQLIAEVTKKRTL